MDDYLPDISLKINISAQDFMSRMYEICIEAPQVKVRQSYVISKVIPNISIEFLLAENYNLENLYGQFYYIEAHSDRIWVELSSRSWAIELPSYDRYVELINQLMKPFLTSYNRKFQTKRKFHIPSYQQIVPKMSPYIREAFDNFVNGANRSSLHSKDWEHFYSFIRVCHSLNTKLTAEELQWFLSKEGFAECYIEKLGCIYRHGRGILKKQYTLAPHPAALRRTSSRK